MAHRVRSLSGTTVADHWLRGGAKYIFSRNVYVSDPKEAAPRTSKAVRVQEMEPSATTYVCDLQQKRGTMEDERHCCGGFRGT